EVVAVGAEVVVTGGSLAPSPVLEATRTIPVVMTNVPDPVGAGWVQSLARPGGNATGFTNFEYSLGGKWVEWLKQIAPGITRAVVLRSATSVAGGGPVAAGQAPPQKPGGGGAPGGGGGSHQRGEWVEALAGLGHNR